MNEHVAEANIPVDVTVTGNTSVEDIKAALAGGKPKRARVAKTPKAPKPPKVAKVKVPKAPKPPKVKVAGSRSVRPKLDADLVVNLGFAKDGTKFDQTDHLPCHPGTARFARWSKLKPGYTIADNMCPEIPNYQIRLYVERGWVQVLNQHTGVVWGRGRVGWPLGHWNPNEGEQPPTPVATDAAAAVVPPTAEGGEVVDAETESNEGEVVEDDGEIEEGDEEEDE